MSPQTARRPTIGETELEALQRPALGVAGPLTALPERPRPADEYGRARLLRREALHRRLLGAADVAAAAATLVVVLLAMHRGEVALIPLAGAPLVVVLFKVAGLYDRDQVRLAHSTLDEAPLLLQLTGLYALAFTIVAPLLGASLAAPQIAALWLVGFLATLLGRVLARAVAAKASPVQRCLVIGEPQLADRVRDKLGGSRVRAEVVATLPLADELQPPWGQLPALRAIVDELRLDRVIIAPTTSDARGVAELIRTAKATGVRVSVLPRMFEVMGSAVEFDHVAGLTMLGVRPFGLSRSSRALKRAFDLVFTSLGVLAVAPIMLAVALAVRLDSKGPILFRQVRIGRDGKPFKIFKFRSMVVDAEEQKERLRAFNEAGDGLFKLGADPRVTRVGALLRKSSLDELPQLLNVLRGEMSLVGPRPLVVDEDAKVLGLDRARLHLTPGMTGPWQVLESRVPMQEMVAIDYLYVASWSLWADLKLLLRTVRHVTSASNV